MALLRFILILVLLYFFVNLILKMLFGNANRTQRPGFDNTRDQYRKKEGEVFVDKDSRSDRKRFSKQDGEYVKYEEIDNDKED
jgi:hypothetical protein